ncbi:class I SAM-dependent methyltransferase [Inhella gelatinilytica]|uniref:Class I SAM-dependent methyltransferase n=1 Tax=Inhella gelatinilytica TaxID=2795030 RepID=A0A931IU34_9BURK|nr:class I SAM-dependent methyltransferase [Inhella gelatinilytica]MBH9552760.1 class I SAM-dependent methyltransferase [Inhella gelatinilytica]
MAGLTCAGLAGLHRRPARRWITLLGLPVAYGLVSAAIPAWIWLLSAVLILVLYPPNRWGEAPLYLTPASALSGVGLQLQLPSGGRGLDAGCGSGAGLRALRREWPQLVWSGTEASALLAQWTRWRCPWATIRCGDLWLDDWRSETLVYVFLRPESMEKVREKARAELQPGACLLSLDFPLPDVKPSASWPAGGRHRLYLYRAEALN